MKRLLLAIAFIVVAMLAQASDNEVLNAILGGPVGSAPRRTANTPPAAASGDSVAVPAQTRSSIAPPVAPVRRPPESTHIEAEYERDAATWPFAMGLVPPVQFPMMKDDILGFRLGILWARNHIVQGLDINALAGETTDNFLGLHVSGLYSGIGEDMTGLQIAGLVNVAGRAEGVQISGIVNYASDCSGVQISFANAVSGLCAGMQIGFWNDAGEMAGVQIGVVNNAKSLSGVQIGLSNYVADSPVRWLPVMNVCF